MVGIIAEMAVIDRDFRDGPIIAALHREILGRAGKASSIVAAPSAASIVLRMNCLPLAGSPSAPVIGNGVATRRDPTGGVVPGRAYRLQ